MFPFLLLLLLPILVQHTKINGISYQVKNKFALKIFFFILFLLLALKHQSVGKDTMNYIHIFHEIGLLSTKRILTYSSEIGFTLLNKLINLFTQEAQYLFILVSLFTIKIIKQEYIRLNCDTSLTIVLFCIMSTFVMLFSGIRQMIAVAIGFYSYNYVRRRNKIGFLISVLIAFSFHNSAFILLFMYPLYYMKFTKKWLFVIVPLIVMVFLFNSNIFQLLIFFLEKYTRFTGSISSTSAYTMIILFVIFSIFCFVLPDDKKIDEEFIGLRNFLLFSLIIQMFAPLHNLAMRMNYYYIIFIPLLIPLTIKYSSNKYKKIAHLARKIIITFFIVYFFYTLVVSRPLNVYPYHFMWESVL